MKTSQAIAEYLLEHEINGSTKATLDYYRRNLGWFCDFLQDCETEEITLQEARKYVLKLRERDITSVSVQTYTRAIRSFLTWCHTEGYIPVNIPKKLRLPKATRKKIDVLTLEEAGQLLNSIDTRNFLGLRDMVVVLFMLDSGLRLEEVTKVEKGKIHIEEGYLIALGKGNKERYVPMGVHLRKYLIKYLSKIPELKPKDKVVKKDDMTDATYSTICNLFKRLKKRSGIPRLRPHLLRHTFATRFLSLGGDIYSLQAILGHTTLHMTKAYVHMIPEKIAVNFPRFSPVDNLFKNPRKGS